MGIQTFPAVEVLSGLNFELISTTNMGTGTPASITLSTIDPKYKILKVIIAQSTSSASRNLFMRFNGNTSTVYAKGVQGQQSGGLLSDQGHAAALNLNTDFADTQSQSSEIFIFDANLAQPSTISFNGTGSLVYFGWGQFNVAAALTSITILHNAAQTFSAGTLYLLGSE
jgi:hypothetical protein